MLKDFPILNRHQSLKIMNLNIDEVTALTFVIPFRGIMAPQYFLFFLLSCWSEKITISWESQGHLGPWTVIFQCVCILSTDLKRLEDFCLVRKPRPWRPLNDYLWVCLCSIYQPEETKRLPFDEKTKGITALNGHKSTALNGHKSKVPSYLPNRRSQKIVIWWQS